MIRAESFAVSRETFAAERKQVLLDAAAALRPHVLEALNRFGLPSWEAPIVSEALDLFDLTARGEVDSWNPVLDDMHDAFAEELAKALEKTTRPENVEAAAERLTGWIAQMAHNAAIEAATTSDPDDGVGLEWVTMGDGNVRDAHVEANGQTVPTGQEFEVGGEKMLYPGQPVGDPANWINCRCLAAPVMLTEASVSRETLVASGDKPFTTATVMALPTASDPITSASSEADGAHCTLLYFGEMDVLDRSALVQDLQDFIRDGGVTPFTDKVSGRATLGDGQADVVLLDGANITAIRNGLLEKPYLRAAYESIEQFPNFIPHVTLGYPETPANGAFAEKQVTFDRIALWFGEDRSAEFNLGDNVPKEEGGTMPEKELPDDVTASIREDAPVEDAEPAPAAEPAVEEGREPDPQLKPWHGVLAPENVPSGDSRQFAINALTSRDLPLPLKAMFVDDEGHKGSVVVGRIDEIYRDGGLIKAAGVWDISPEAEKAAGMIDRKMWRGVSVDLDAAEGEMVKASEEDGGRDAIEFSKGRVCSATLCAIPAFAEAFVRNGTWAEFASEPLPTGGMIEIPDWPGDAQPETSPALSLVASAAPAISVDYFRNPMLEEPTPVTRGENGHIFGHLGIWDQCHIAYEVCTTVPPSETDYAYFLTGQVFTDAGSVAVGQLTVGGGHAPDGISVRAAIAHYDNVGTAVADVTCGEDEHGVWFSGRIRPWATEKQIHELFAAGPSGDWRGVRYRGRDSMELVAAHAVNVPGFPVPRPRFAVEHGRQTSLVAAGALGPGKADAAAVFADLAALEFSHITDELTSMKEK